MRNAVVVFLFSLFILGEFMLYSMKQSDYETIESPHSNNISKIIYIELKLSTYMARGLWDIIVALIKLQGLVLNGACFSSYKNDQDFLKNESFKFYKSLYKTLALLGGDLDDRKQEPFNKVYAGIARNDIDLSGILIIEFNSEKDLKKIKNSIDDLLKKAFSASFIIGISCIECRSFSLEAFEKCACDLSESEISGYLSSLRDTNDKVLSKSCFIF